MQFDKIFDISLIYATFRSATPIIYAALCAAITQQADILNIGTEGIMLTGAFTAVTVSYFTGSWVLGILISMVAGLLIAMIMAVGHIKYKAEICAIGMGINLFAIAFTKFMLNSVLGVSGSFTSPQIKGIPKVHMPFLDGVPVLDSLFNNWSVTEWFVIVLVFIMMFLFYKTVWGLRLRAVGQFPMAAETAGINVPGNSHIRPDWRAGRSSSVPGIQPAIYRGHDEFQRIYGCGRPVFWRSPSCAYSGRLSDIRIYGFIGSPHTGVWCSIPVCIADALRGDHCRAGCFHDI